MSELAAMLNMEDEATWTAEGDAFVNNRIYGAYASDTILIWAHTLFPEARGLSVQERAARASDPAHGWEYLPIPCDRFLEACSELVCEALELELPVRGAIAMGRAILDSERGVFLGQPIIDTARMEKNQKLIGASICGSYLNQVIPGPYAVPFNSHVKDSKQGDFSGLVLNWPRHWRVTRGTDLTPAISRLNTAPDYSAAYDNSLEMNRLSQSLAQEMRTDNYVSTRRFYRQFASPKLEMKTRAVCSAMPPIN
ncbi:MAG: hypothetical protein AB7F79_03000 [Steroidobacteraceae bacterium]